MAETCLAVLAYFWKRQEFMTNHSFNAQNINYMMTHHPWYSMTLQDIYQQLHCKFNGNSAACSRLLSLLPQREDARKHVVGVAGVWLLYCYTHSYCRSRNLHPDTPLVLQQLQQIMESVVSGCQTQNKETGELVWEGPLCQTVQPEHTIFDCLEYWFERQQQANKNHAMAHFIDMQLIRSEMASYTLQ